ncbi:ATP-dependent RecD-like DNA helicase [Kordia antarctica]|uniref:ATP-dependent RecD-like DNA helicase n=1 Tax=Kordia antarctica TaxID=1218801 RepID=A0A7L4ZQA5_9FLAO|nr:AAA domain-containing protein [Kordia antarctica]QHI38657.1 ATP-dependent RecD-like DNA helicase [Kordia antarctica]
MRGKIILKYDTLGYIEYNVDSRVSYVIEENLNFNIGEEVNFEMIEKRVTGTDDTFDRAIHLTQIEKKLETEISREERGSIIATTILEIIKPSTIVLEFYKGRKAILPLQNIAWNLPSSEKLFDTYKVGDSTEIVVLENEPNKSVLVSRKHLVPRPSEEKNWQDLKIGDILKGTIVQVLETQLVFSFPNKLFGTAIKPKDFSKTIGEVMEVQVLSKSVDRFLLSTTVSFEATKSNKKTTQKYNDDSLVKSKLTYKHGDESLKDANSFFNSLYYDYCEESETNNEKKFFQEAFADNHNLFDLAISLKLPLHIQFTSTSWDGDFKSKLLPYLASFSPELNSEQKAIDYLCKQKYWMNIDSRKENRCYWTLFNDELYISGFVTEEPDERFFFVSKLEIGRKNKDSSYYKEKSQKNGCFLYDSKIFFLKLHSNIPVLDKPLAKVFDVLKTKSDAFLLYGELKKKTGALLMEEGESLKIFDKFLEYQIYREKENNKQKAISVSGHISRIPAIDCEVSIETIATESLQNIYESSELERILVSIKTSEDSSKEKSNEKELVWFCDAEFEIVDNTARFHFSVMDKSIEDLESEFYVEPKLSLKQWQVQRKVIQDFFDKRINISHIETMFLKPDKIKAPKFEPFNFINPLLNKTRIDIPDNNQVKSVIKAVGNENIFLIQGPPGTGKTTVIAEIVQQLTNKGERVLVTSQTHVAVDNVLDKLSQLDHLTLVRFGNKKRIMSGLEGFHIDNQVDALAMHYGSVVENNIKLVLKKIECANLSDEEITITLLEYLSSITINYPPNFDERLTKLNKDFISTLSDLAIDQLNNLISVLKTWQKEIASSLLDIARPIIYDSMNVGFATCIGVRVDKGLSGRNIIFDTVIIDEAGKANLSESIAAVSMAKKVILVGDHKQLPPYIDSTLIDLKDKDSFPNSDRFNRSKFNNEDIKHALTTSLFEFLVNKNKANLFPPTNIELLNFQHRMHPDIGEFVSNVFYDSDIQMGASTSNNTLPLAFPFDKQVIFIDTANSKTPYESNGGTSYKNNTEAFCISEIIIPRLLDEKVGKDKFAVIAPYKAQVANIISKLEQCDISGVEVSTLDSFQGMEFDIIIFSFTRSKRWEKVGFLDDARRLNVALSRAKKKLILVGNSKTLMARRSHYDEVFNYTKMYRNLVKLSKNEEKGNFIDINNLSAESKFDKAEKKLKKDVAYNCLYLNSVNLGDDQLHIFNIENLIDGALFDKGKTKSFQDSEKIKLVVEKINIAKKKFYLKETVTNSARKKAIHSNKKTPNHQLETKMFQLKFFNEHKVGDVVKCRYKWHIKGLGHFFEIFKGLDGLMYDSDFKMTTYVSKREYNMFISKIDKYKKQITLIGKK